MPAKNAHLIGNKHAVGNKGGRPTDYRPEFCEQIVILAKDGLGKDEIAAKLGVSDNSLVEWAKNYPEFATAVQLAQQQSFLWWMDIARKNLIQSRDWHFNERTWQMNMMNRFNWNKKEETTLKGELGEAMKEIATRRANRAKSPNATR